jgi:DNA-binding response OmpR family regulator
MSKENKKVLMIEDDIFLRKIYRDKLERSGLDFVEAINGEEGINKVISEKPTIVLLDIILPKKNGFDVLREIKDNEETKDIPVVILSNLGQEADVRRGMALGADDYFVKTEVTLEEVVSRINEWLK